MAAKPLNATLFDGHSAQAQACELHWEAGQLRVLGGLQGPRSYAAAQIVWPERTRHGQRQLLLPDGAVVSLPDAQAWDAWAEQVGLVQPLAARWALSWRGVGLAFGLLVLTVLLAWRWGIPWGARQAADWVPATWEQRLGQQVMQDVEQRWLKPSALPEAEQRQIEAAVRAMAQAAYPDEQRPAYRLHLRKGPKWLGPNAFALPGGDVVVMDALVDLLREPGRSVAPSLLGVVAHELGHVRERHGLRMLFESAALSALAGWWIGDYSAVMAGAPVWLAQAQYSRGHERSADAEAKRVLRAAGLDPAEMARFFEKLAQAEPQRSGDEQHFGLASHPADAERIRFFKQADQGNP